jgi:hypothetical protein
MSDNDLKLQTSWLGRQPSALLENKYLTEESASRSEHEGNSITTETHQMCAYFREFSLIVLNVILCVYSRVFQL